MHREPLTAAARTELSRARLPHMLPGLRFTCVHGSGTRAGTEPGVMMQVYDTAIDALRAYVVNQMREVRSSRSAALSSQ